MKMTEHNTIELGCTDDEMEILNKTFVVTITNNEYKMLISKAAALDILTAQIRTTGEINETVVRAITGTLETNELVPKSEADSYFGWYMEQKKKADERSKKIADLERANIELRELLRQNNIGIAQEEKEEA